MTNYNFLRVFNFRFFITLLLLLFSLDMFVYRTFLAEIDAQFFPFDNLEHVDSIYPSVWSAKNFLKGDKSYLKIYVKAWANLFFLDSHRCIPYFRKSLVSVLLLPVKRYSFSSQTSFNKKLMCFTFSFKILLPLQIIADMKMLFTL